MKSLRNWRSAWPWLIGSLVLHVVLLAAMPGLDRDERCPVILLVTLAAPASQANVVEPAKPTLPEPIPAPVKPVREKQQTPRPAPAKPKPVPELTQPSAEPATAEPAIQAAPVYRRLITSRRADSGAAEPVSASHPPAQPTVAPPAPEPERQVDLGPLKRNYAQSARLRIAAKQFFPQEARTAEIDAPVQVKLKVVIAASGALNSVNVTKSSGIAVIDQAALSAVRSAAPFAPFPAELTTDSVEMSIPLEYNLR